MIKQNKNHNLLLKKTNCLNKFKKIKQETKELTDEINVINKKTENLHKILKDYNNINLNLEKDIKEIKKWKTNNESPKILREKINIKIKEIEQLEIRLDDVKNNCNLRINELDELINSFL